jgi:hypothetical protein
MEDLVRYVEEFVNPAIEDFAQHPDSVRHGFMACVAAFHGVDYLAWPEDAATLRSELRKKNEHFKTIDDVAHAFKHVATSKRPNKGLKASEVVAVPAGIFDHAVFDQSAFDAAEGKVTIDKDREINLLNAVRKAVEYLMTEGRRIGNEALVRRMQFSVPQSRPQQDQE